MDRIVIKSRVGSDGILNLALPMMGRADQEVQVTVEPLSQQTVQEWQQGILESAGKWQGDFERPDQGDYEEREPLS